MNKFYLIDKPIWLTSFDVLRKLKKILWIKKMWHTWTLDPLATGLLLVAIWDYTKLIPYFEKDTKEYEFKINLDWTTPSFDSETEIEFLTEDKKAFFKQTLSKEQITEILKEKFTWTISQMPPKYSALKIWWHKALDLVRAWVDFELKSREVTIFNIEILNFNYPEIHLKAKVSAWTYIRSIACDLWEILWTGWYITFLRRTQIWNLDLSLSQKLEEFEEWKYLKEENLFDKNKFIKLSQEELKDINNWKIINNINKNLQENEEYFVINDEKITNIVKNNGSTMQPVRKI